MGSQVEAQCQDEAGAIVPIIDRNRCEGKSDCVQVCPFEVFELRELSASQKGAMSLMGRVKAWAHGNEQAFVVRPDECHACGLCVKACPEKAISLRKR